MRKINILLITPDFPPKPDIGGLRMAMFSKYLLQLGCNIYVLTGYTEDDLNNNSKMNIIGLPQEENIFRVKYEESNNRNIFEKILSFLMVEIYQTKDYYFKLYSKGESILENNRIDLIMGTTPPLSNLTIASRLSLKYSKPWIADFRDIVEQDPKFCFRDILLKYRILYRRKKIVKSASLITTVSKHHKKTLEESLKKSVSLIEYGFDSTMFKPIFLHSSKIFTITYMGRLLDLKQRNPSILFEAIDDLIKNNIIPSAKIKILFYGTEKELLNELLKKYECRICVTIFDIIDYDKVPKVLQESCLNLVLSSKTSLGVLTTKLFEYLAVNRPILSIPNDHGELAEVINISNGGFVCDTKEELVQKIKELFLIWENTFTIKSNTNLEFINKFSREYQSKCLYDMILKVLSND